MAHHFYLLGIERASYHFWVGSVFVEMFFIITGCYTAKHFFEHQKNESRMKLCFQYTIRKFIKFYPMVVFFVTIQYVTEMIINAMRGVDINAIVCRYIEEYILEIAMISSLGSNSHMGTMWFLSSMFIVFPIFCYFILTNDKHLVVYVSLISCICYYNITNVFNGLPYFNDLLRALAGLFLGFALFYILQIFSNKIEKFNLLVLTLIQMLSFIAAIWLTYANQTNAKLVVFCFVIFIAISLTGKSFINDFKCDFFEYIGKLSVPMFFSQWCIGYIIGNICGIDNNVKILLYYVITIIISAITVCITERIQSSGIASKEINNGIQLS